MKRLSYLLPMLLAASCASTSGIQLQKETTADVTNITACDTCVQVRIKNMGPDNISSVLVENSKGETYFFAGIKAGKTSAYQSFRSLCNCGYNIQITYFKTEDNNTTLPGSCQNIVECHDFFQGKATIEINTPKLPDTLSKTVGRTPLAEINIRKD